MRLTPTTTPQAKTKTKRRRHAHAELAVAESVSLNPPEAPPIMAASPANKASTHESILSKKTTSNVDQNGPLRNKIQAISGQDVQIIEHVGPV
jgi:hypothetical protein